jgi:tetratricopeptide (TPR) repeat protein
MSDSSEGRRLHAVAEETRERGDFAKALDLINQAIFAYQKDNDLLGLSEVLASQEITFKHLYRRTADPVFLILEKHAGLSAIGVAESSGQKEALALPYFNLGKFYAESKEYTEAAEFFRKALENLHTTPNERHGRPAVMADIAAHLAAAEYHSGDASALERMQLAISDLEKADEPDDYKKHVWLSGAHLRVAMMVKDDDNELAKKHVEAARKIIESDERLVLRKEQLEKVEKLLNH